MTKIKKVFCFDLDNVICTTHDSNYELSIPNLKVIKKINELKSNGHIIKIFTARFMGRNNENIILAKKQVFNFTKKQLLSWGLDFDILIFGKPVYDIFVDDKNFDFKDNWFDDFSKKY